MISSNAPQIGEGSIANLLDGDTNSYFHSAWSNDPTASGVAHNLVVTLSAEKSIFALSFNNRNHANGKPKVIKVLGSDDNGATWFDITTLNQGMPTANAGLYISPQIESPKPFKKLRFDVTETQAGSKYFCLSEFALYAKQEKKVNKFYTFTFPLQKTAK